MRYAHRTLQDAFRRALSLEAGLQLAEGVHLGRSPQVKQVSTSESCHHDSLEGCVHQANVRDSGARSNAFWKCGGLGHFQKDCKATLNVQGGDREDAVLSDANSTIGQTSHTLTTSMQITNLTFKAILKELVSTVIGNRRTFCRRHQTTLKTPIQPSMGGVSMTVATLVTAATNTSKTPSTSLPTPSTISSESTSHPANANRGPLQARHQAAVSQGTRVGLINLSLAWR